MDPREKERLWNLHIVQKIEKSKSVIIAAIDRFGVNNIALAITGGKDSTTNLWLFKQVCDEMGDRIPICMFIDEGDVFDEISEFVAYLKKVWSLEIAFLRNDDVIMKAASLGGMVKVASLNETNQNALKEISFLEPEFPFVPDSPICNHLMKTIPMRGFIVKNKLKALSTAIRWDEIGAREDEDYFAERDNPPHTRVHPILHLKERDIWIAIFKYDLPFNKLYKLGYRSLGARCATNRVSDIPAWMQDLENTPERLGRGKEKEQVMDQLRALGYM